MDLYSGRASPVRPISVAAAIIFVSLATGALAEEVKLEDRKSTRLNSSHLGISYAVFCLKKKSHLTTAAQKLNNPIQGQLKVREPAAARAPSASPHGQPRAARTAVQDTRCRVTPTPTQRP